MTTLRWLGWIALAVGLGLVAMWLLSSDDSVSDPVVQPMWEIEATDPAVIGGPGDRFVYTGGDRIVPVDGRLSLKVEPDGRGDLTIDLESPIGIAHGTQTASHVVLRAAFDAADLIIDGSIGGDTGLGEPRLPETRAQLAGSASFDVRLDDRAPIGPVVGFWSVAAAIRKEDGGIRQQGLVYSPLLREKTGFSDPDRLEATIVLYDAGTADEPPVALHVVFRVVDVVGGPNTVD